MSFILPCFFGRKHCILSFVDIILHLVQSLDWKEIFYFGMKFTVITKHTPGNFYGHSSGSKDVPLVIWKKNTSGK